MWSPGSYINIKKKLIERGIRKADTLLPNLFTAALEETFKTTSFVNKKSTKIEST